MQIRVTAGKPCPFWVINGPDRSEIQLPLFPRERTQVGHRAVSVWCPATDIADPVRGRPVLVVRCPCRSQGNHGIRVLASSYLPDISARQSSDCATLTHEFTDSLNILILAALRERALVCRAEVEKTRCGSQRAKLINGNIGSRVDFTGRCDRRRYCLIVAYSGVRRLSEVSLE
jgi:hypothetical protein